MPIKSPIIPIKMDIKRDKYFEDLIDGFRNTIIKKQESVAQPDRYLHLGKLVFDLESKKLFLFPPPVGTVEAVEITNIEEIKKIITTMMLKQ